MNQLFSISFVDMFANGLIAVLAMIVMLVVTINSSAVSKYGYAYFEISHTPCDPESDSRYYDWFVTIEPDKDDLKYLRQWNRPDKCAVRYVVFSDGDNEVSRTLTWIRPVERSNEIARWTSAENKLGLVGRDFNGNPIQGCDLTFDTKTEVRFTATGVSCVAKL